MLAAIAAGVSAPLPIRVPLGLLAVLVAPGYTAIAALFPGRNDLHTATRLGLSVSTSIMLAAALAPLLSHSPWALRATPSAVTVATVVVLAAAVAAWRRGRLPTDDAPDVSAPAARWSSWAPSTTFAALALALGVAIAGAGLYQTLRAPEPRFTEFYLLGREGWSESYMEPDQAAGAARMTIGITNREGETATYRVVIAADDRVHRRLGPVSLVDGERWEQALSLNPSITRRSRRITLTLLRDGRDAPYRSLSLRAAGSTDE